MHTKPLTALESGCHPSLGTNMADGVTTVRDKPQEEATQVSFLSLVQDCQPEASIKQSRAVRLSLTSYVRVWHGRHSWHEDRSEKERC